MRHSFLVILAATVIAGLARPATGHHSFAAFDITTQKAVTGTVKQVDWTNPHIWLWIDVANDKGGSDTYGFEGMSPNFLARRGWTRTTLKTGDKITINYRPMKDGSKGGMFMTGQMATGKLLSMMGGNDEPGR
ncbi:MAG: hypothetical protein DMG14_20850 [Acidobacteria bacterium]|nr:MAG: hypothetical protein DMG14_20850 [Acidobacteriota bacterium]